MPLMTQPFTVRWGCQPPDGALQLSFVTRSFRPFFHLPCSPRVTMKKSLLIAAVLSGFTFAAQATELFVNISTDETMAQGAGLVLAVCRSSRQRLPSLWP